MLIVQMVCSVIAMAALVMAGLLTELATLEAEVACAIKYISPAWRA